MKIGNYKINILETGTLALDGGAMFGIIPKPLWQRTNPADEKNRITLGAKCMLLQSDSKNILIDTGVGDGWDEKFISIYGVDHSKNTLLNSLSNFNLTPEDITDVILTHLHFDHVGGAVTIDEGKSSPTFINAKYHVQKEQFDWALNPSQKDRGSFIKNRFVPIHEEGMLNLLHEDQFDNEIELVIINGHTFAQQMIKLSDSKNTLLFCADLIPTSGHIPIPFVMGYDNQPLITVKEKQKILQQATDEEWLLIFEHDPINLGAKIAKTEKGFLAKEFIKEL